MGGDFAPQATVAGAMSAARALPDVDVLLVGDETVLRAELASHGVTPANLLVHHASQAVDMCEAPGQAIRQKPKSSIAVGMKLVRDGKAHAFVSAGNSGAAMAAAVLILKPQPGIDRPAIAFYMPTRTGVAIMLDAGANTDCKPANLLQFARLGHDYARAMLELEHPRIGLLSIGEEPTKGDELTKEAHQLLQQQTELNFVGNVEPKEFVRGEVDVVVCDGFVGNLMLKAGEAMGELILGMLKEEISRSWTNKLAALLLRPVFRGVKKHFDYAEYGGALLLGVNGVVIIGHGRSTLRAIENAVCLAARVVKQQHLAPSLQREHGEALQPATQP